MRPNYDALTAHLRAIEDAVVVITFAEIDRVVGGDGLPPSARHYPAFWANSVRSQPHSRAWLNARRTASVDFNAGRVTFTLGAAPPGTLSAPRPGAPYRKAPAPPMVVVAPALHPTGESVRAEVSFAWLGANPVTLVGAKLRMPLLGVRPGIYRFELRGDDGKALRSYVGESDNLERRMGNYRNPGPTQPTNVRLNQLLQEILEAGGSVTVSVVLEGTFDGRPLDLAAKPARLLIENAALVAMAADGVVIENLGSGQG
jgi:hypothetical protein